MLHSWQVLKSRPYTFFTVVMGCLAYPSNEFHERPKKEDKLCLQHCVSLSLSHPSDAEIHNVVNEAVRIDAAGGVMPELCHQCIATMI